MAAALMCSGVSKSGSPAPNPHTSIPSDFIALALLSIERVRDGVKVEALDESCIKDCFRTTCATRSFQPRNSFRSSYSIQEFRSCILRSSGVAGVQELQNGPSDFSRQLLQVPPATPELRQLL